MKSCQSVCQLEVRASEQIRDENTVSKLRKARKWPKANFETHSHYEMDKNRCWLRSV